MDQLAKKYLREGYPTTAELIAAQGLSFPRDPLGLPGDFCPEEEPVDEFPAGHARVPRACQERPRCVSAVVMSDDQVLCPEIAKQATKSPEVAGKPLRSLERPPHKALVATKTTAGFHRRTG
jgi:hypothetical protein